jgi:hypothetical protein
MSDAFDPPGAGPGESAAAGDDADGPGGSQAEAGAADAEPYPWDREPPPADPDAPRERHDAFTEARKSGYLRALVKCGCILDACRLTGVAPQTVYRHQRNDPSFFENCRIALRVAGTPAELTAWSRAVEGVEQEFACGGQVHVRRRYSDGLLRLLLQGSNPKKYGPHPGFTRKRILKHERKQMEREIRAGIAEEMAAHSRSPEQVRASIRRKLEAIERHEEPQKLAAGWTRSADGYWIPPGYGPIPGWQPAAALDTEGGESGTVAAGAQTPRDSM